MAHNVFRFIAVKKITAEHPLGSGIHVTYDPGDEVPANEWGRATDNLIEVGKIQRVAVLMSDEDDPPEGAVGHSPLRPETEQTADEVNAATANDPPPAAAGGDAWPRDLGKGQYELSDGSKVYGKNKAQAAQEALGADNQGGDGA